MLNISNCTLNVTECVGCEMENSTCTESLQLVEDYLNGIHDILRVIYTIVLVFILIISVAGNALTLLTVVKTVQYHTIVNACVMGLSICDMLSATLIIPAVVAYNNGAVHVSAKYCEFISCLNTFCQCMTSWTFVAIIFDRFWGISKPHKYAIKTAKTCLRIYFCYILFQATILSVSQSRFQYGDNSDSKMEICYSFVTVSVQNMSSKLIIAKWVVVHVVPFLIISSIVIVTLKLISSRTKVSSVLPLSNVAVIMGVGATVSKKLNISYHHFVGRAVGTLAVLILSTGLLWLPRIIYECCVFTEIVPINYTASISTLIAYFATKCINPLVFFSNKKVCIRLREIFTKMIDSSFLQSTTNANPIPSQHGQQLQYIHKQPNHVEVVLSQITLSSMLGGYSAENTRSNQSSPCSQSLYYSSARSSPLINSITKENEGPYSIEVEDLEGYSLHDNYEKACVAGTSLYKNQNCLTVPVNSPKVMLQCNTSSTVCGNSDDSRCTSSNQSRRSTISSCSRSNTTSCDNIQHTLMQSPPRQHSPIDNGNIQINSYIIDSFENSDDDVTDYTIQNHTLNTNGNKSRSNEDSQNITQSLDRKISYNDFPSLDILFAQIDQKMTGSGKGYPFEANKLKMKRCKSDNNLTKNCRKITHPIINGWYLEQDISNGAQQCLNSLKKSNLSTFSEFKEDRVNLTDSLDTNRHANENMLNIPEEKVLYPLDGKSHFDERIRLLSLSQVTEATDGKLIDDTVYRYPNGLSIVISDVDNSHIDNSHL